jgi:hypothetical protein
MPTPTEFRQQARNRVEQHYQYAKPILFNRRWIGAGPTSTRWSGNYSSRRLAIATSSGAPQIRLQPKTPICFTAMGMRAPLAGCCPHPRLRSLRIRRDLRRGSSSGARDSGDKLHKICGMQHNRSSWPAFSLPSALCRVEQHFVPNFFASITYCRCQCRASIVRERPSNLVRAVALGDVAEFEVTRFWPALRALHP